MVSVNFSVGKPYSVYNYIELQISRLKNTFSTKKYQSILYYVYYYDIYIFDV